MKVFISLTLLIFVSFSHGNSNDKISLSFDRAEIHQVLKAIAELRQLNLVVTDKVNGSVSVKLDNVPWLQALELVAQLHQLEFELQQNVLLVAPLGELTKQKLAQIELNEKLANTASLQTKLFEIRFAKAKDLVTTLNNSVGALLSSRGRVMADDRTNSLIVQDTPHVLSSIEQALVQLDKKAKQVVIEARMVTIRDNLDEQLGIQWGISGESSNTAISGSLSALEQIRSQDISQTNYLDRLNVS